jgi:dienelactone hydrolase
VFVAPAGTRMLHGMHLSEGDTPEHLPYARAGFAVVAYELSGHFTERPRITLGMLAGPIRQFMAADGGLANARAAIDFVSRQVPEVDPNRLYAAGHSSAATMALNLAAADRRIRACCAYAPACDVEARWRGELAGMERLVPGVSDFAARLSPVEHVADFSCPIYLFHADNDERVDVADNQDFADALKQAGKQVTFVRIRFGGHYESMISDGIPGGIHWLEGLGAKPLPPVVNGSEAVSPGTSGG